MPEATWIVTTVITAIGAIAALWRVHVERQRNKVLRRQLELAQPRPDVQILGIRPTGGGTHVTFVAEVQNVGTKPTRVTASARVGSRAVGVYLDSPDLLVNAPPVRIEVAVPRPELGDLMPACGDATTLYDETLHVRVEADKQSVEATWREELYDPVIDNARYEVQQAFWRRGRGDETADDRRADAIRQHEERIERGDIDSGRYIDV